ncbi:hypothetical protein [Natronomonas sp. EA1]|uniref:hypothetical protein n=1 Tax=Natronomonas sp. EA1 TaxID=3421655 RepID=UPI003EBF44A9
MKLDSLPARPLELSELRELEGTGQFTTVLPVAVFTLHEADYKLVAAFVAVTEKKAVAIGYDTEEGWTKVATNDTPETQEELESAARGLNTVLRDWAQKTKQQWADPDGTGVLLEAFRRDRD